MGEMFMENKEWEKAKETFEKALIVVQELDKTEKEAELCEKLGTVHFKLERNEEAIVYFNQFLMISQQQKNANSMLIAYGHLTQVHLKQENLEEGFDCAKFLLTLSDILNNSKEKITALLSIGRIFSKKKEYLIAIKILSKARRLAEKTDSKRELALCFGYLGECQLKINQRQKALTNFCKQLNYFPYINDAEDKCETIAHLIEEKILTNDVVWCAKLCRLQEDIAKEGSISLQMKVLRESAAKMHSLGCLDETTKSMEKALMLSIENEHPNTVTILLELCEYYCETEQYHKAILALKEFAELQDGICGPDVFYQLSVMFLTQNRIEESIENLEKCQTFNMVDNRFMYALSFAYYKKGDFKNAYFWLMQYIEANLVEKNIQQEKLLWERSLKELNLLVRTNVGPIIQYLDALNLYTELEADLESFLPLDCQIHFSIAKKDYDKANHYLQFYGDTKLCYMFENIAVNMLLNNPIEIFVDATFYNFVAEDYIPCFFKPSAHQMSKALAAILAISNFSMIIESIRCIEVLLWKEAFYEFTKAGKSFDISEPTYEDIENSINSLSTFFYCFSVDDIYLIWIKNIYGKIEMFYNIESGETSFPQFYTNVIKQVLFNSKIHQISAESIDLHLRNCVTCIGCNEIYKENYFSLLDFSTSTLRDFSEALALIADSKNEDLNENVIKIPITSDLSKQELLSRIIQTSVIFLDLDDISEELLHPSDLFEIVMSTNLCILCTKISPNRAVEIAKSMILNGCQWIIIVNDSENAKNVLLSFLEGDLPKTLDIEIIKKMFANNYATFYTHPNSEKNIKIRGLSWMARRIICEEEYLDSYLKTEKDFSTYSYEFALHERLKQVLSLHNDSITANDIAKIKQLSQEKYPYTEFKEYIYQYDDQENITKLFLDLFPYQNKNMNKNLDSSELFQLMKSFEIRSKWRRRKKGKLSTRDYCSDGERFSILSDKELTDSESISGARVIGFDVEDAEYKY
uniref:Tetratricopeptide repeat protein n=1 Tax=Panagrolaimus sp. PS1159 TaxID=55785 RepID=A0AC35G5I8_9BILA